MDEETPRQIVKRTIRAIRRNVSAYLNLDNVDLQSDPEVFSAALLTSAKKLVGDNAPALQQRIIDQVFLVSPHPVEECGQGDFLLCYDVLTTGNTDFIEMYLRKAGPYLLEYVEHLFDTDDDLINPDQEDFVDKYPMLFRSLPKELRQNRFMLKLAIQTLVEDTNDMVMLLCDCNPDVFIEQPKIIVELLTGWRELDPDCSFWHVFPTELSHNRELVSTLLVSGFEVPLSVFPDELRSDRTFFLDLPSNLCERRPPSYEKNLAHLMSDTLKSDKWFIVEYIRYNDPFIFYHCAKELQRDVDVLLPAIDKLRLQRHQRNYMGRFVSKLWHQITAIIQTLWFRMNGRLDFMTFLACCRKSCPDVEETNRNKNPLQLLECGPETSISLKRLIQSYVGNETNETKARMREALYLIVSAALDCVKRPPGLMHSLPREEMVKVIRRKLNLANLPVSNVLVELWSERDFVLKWFMCGCRPHNLIPIEFKSDIDLCLRYYERSVFIARSSSVNDYTPPLELDDCSAWISDSLKANRSFIFQCALMHPYILNFCSDDLRLDADFLLELAHKLCNLDDRGRRLPPFELFAKTACNGSWKVALIKLINAMRTHRVDHTTLLYLYQFMEERKYIGRESNIDSCNVEETIRSYVGVTLERDGDLMWLHRLWAYPSIKNHLAHAKSVEDLRFGQDFDGAHRLICNRERILTQSNTFSRTTTIRVVSSNQQQQPPNAARRKRQRTWVK